MSNAMKPVKASLSLLFLSSVSAVAADNAPSSFAPSVPMITAITSDSKPAVDGVNGKMEIYGGAGQGNSISISGIAGLSPAQSSTVWKGIGGASGTITLPIGHSLGAQVDLTSGTFGNSVQIPMISPTHSDFISPTIPGLIRPGDARLSAA